jgi:hypothetical protein
VAVCGFSGSRIYVFGGQSIFGVFTTFNDCYFYDVVLNTWTHLNDAPVGVYGGNVAVSGSQVFVFAGDAGTLPAFYSYNPTTDSWTELALLGADITFWDRGWAAPIGNEGLIALNAGYGAASWLGGAMEINLFNPASGTFDLAILTGDPTSNGALMAVASEASSEYSAIVAAYADVGFFVLQRMVAP